MAGPKPGRQNAEGERGKSVKIKWTAAALEAYKGAGEEMKQAGFRALRELRDPDCSTVLTFWAGPKGTVIQQTWTDTGDVCFYRAVRDSQEATKAA